MTERIEVSRTIKAPASEIFAVLASPAGHVAIDSSGMLQSFTGSPAAAEDDAFVIHMDREALNDYPMGEYDVTVRFVVFQPDVELAWKIEGQLNIGHVYGYRLSPSSEVEGATVVTSYYDWSTVGDEWKSIFPIISEGALRATLGILARTVAPADGR